MTARVTSRPTGILGILAAGLIIGGLCQASTDQPKDVAAKPLVTKQTNHLRVKPSAKPASEASSFRFVQNTIVNPPSSDEEANSWFNLPTLRFLTPAEPPVQTAKPTATVSEGRRFDPNVAPAGFNSQRGGQVPIRREAPPADPSEIRFSAQELGKTMPGRAVQSALPRPTAPQKKSSQAMEPQQNSPTIFANLPFFHRSGMKETKSPQAAQSLPPMARQPRMDRPARPPQSLAESRPLPRQDRVATRRSNEDLRVKSNRRQATSDAHDTAITMKPIDEPRLVSPKQKETKTEVAITPSVAKLLKRAHEQSKSAESESDYTQLVSTCRKALAEEPNDEVAAYTKKLASWAYNRRGQLRADTGRNKEAFADFADAIEYDSNCWRAIHNRGVLRAESGDLKTAFDDFNRTVELNPKFAKAYVNRASLSVVAGDFYAALRDYRQAITVDPELAMAYKGRGQVNHILGNLTEAEHNFDTAAELAPDDAGIAVARADLLTDLGRYDEARAEYERALNLDSELAQAFRGSAWLLATCPEKRVRDSERALDDAYSAMELDGRQDPANLDTLAAALANAGDFDGAIAAQKRAITLATEAEKEVYQARLDFYEQDKPYRISPIRHAQATEPIEK